MPRCSICQATQSKLNPGDVCLKCKNKGAFPIDEDATLGEIPFKVFRAWHTNELKKVVQEEIAIYNNKLSNEIKTISDRVSELENIKDENNMLKKAVAEQQKYLEILRRDQQSKTSLYQVYQNRYRSRKRNHYTK